MADNWIEVFRAGTHTASSGDKVTISAADVDAIAQRYDAGYHEAPIVIGHPKDNEPAFGWVKGLKSEGGKLLANLHQVSPEFRDMVNAGRFKKRSASFYQDLDGKGQYLRHVGFLGAQPPAVKSLAAVQLAEGDAVAFDFDEERSMDMDESKIRQMLTEFADGIKNAITTTLGKLKPAGAEPADAGVSQKITDAVKAATDAVTASFTEQVNTLKTELGEQKKQLTAAEEAHRQAGIRSFADKLKAEGRWVPAFEKMHLVEFMESLPSGEGSPVIEFSEIKTEDGKTTTTTVKQSPLQFFQEFLEKLPKIVHFGELTGDVRSRGVPTNLVEFTPDNKGAQAVNAELAERTLEISREKKISFEEASTLARKEISATA
jgi:hypothetical protein